MAETIEPLRRGHSSPAPGRDRPRNLGTEAGTRAAGSVTVLRAAGHTIVMRGRQVVVDGERRHVAPAPAALLRALASHPGRVFSRAELLELAWRGAVEDEHVVEVTIGRLRTALGAAGAAIQTVVKRGYRLAVEPPLS